MIDERGRVSIREVCDRIAAMDPRTREVLDFARPKPPTRDPVDVVQVVRQMIALLGPEARKRTATLVLPASRRPRWYSEMRRS